MLTLIYTWEKTNLNATNGVIKKVITEVVNPGKVFGWKNRTLQKENVYVKVISQAKIVRYTTRI